MITMYTKSNCPQCIVAKGKLKIAGVKYTEVFVDKDPAARQVLVDAGHRSVPVIYQDGAAIKLEDLLLQVK